MKLKFGFYAIVQAPENESPSERLRELLEQVASAARYGFDSVFVGQHFLSQPYQMLQPMPLLGRMAAESEGMTIGAGIILLPLLNPVAVAEDAASMDVISSGKFVLGVGLGYRGPEDTAFGVRPREKTQRLEEGLSLIRALWTGEPVDFEGRFTRLQGARISVKPVQQSGPPIWIAATADVAVARAARLADAWLVDPRPPVSTLLRQLELYRQTLRDAGKELPQDFPIVREAFAADTDEEAQAEAGPYLREKYQTYGSWAPDLVDSLSGALGPETSDGRFIVGSPSTCVRGVKSLHEQLGVNHFILRMGWPGMKHASIMKSIKTWGEQVIPELKRN